MKSIDTYIETLVSVLSQYQQQSMDHNAQPSATPDKPPTQQKIGNYELGKTLGSGTFGKVRVATHILTGQQVAIKIIDKKSIKDEEDQERVDRQVEIMKIVRHPNIIQFYERIETEDSIYLVLELAENGELFKLMQDQVRLNQRAAGRIFIQLMNAVEYLHRLGICHRDLKPENILLDVDYNIKLVDFGLSNVFQKGQYLRTACGSPCYAPPEMVSGNVYEGQIGDIWSMGIIFYGMICGTLPFEENTTKQLYKKVIQGFYYIPSDISLQATQAIRKMLVTNPKQRIRIPQLRKLKFFKNLREVEPKIIGIIVGFHPMPIDNEIIEKMKTLMPFEKQKVEDQIKENDHTMYTALYYLLQKQSLRSGGKTIVDLQYFLQSSQRYKNQYGTLPPQLAEQNIVSREQSSQSIKTIKNSKVRQKFAMSNHKGLSKQKRQPIEVTKKQRTQKNNLNLTQRQKSREQKHEKPEEVLTILKKLKTQKKQTSNERVSKFDSKREMMTSRTHRNLKSVVSSTQKSHEKTNKSREHQNISSSNSRKKSQKKVRIQNTNKLALNLWNTYFEKVIESSSKVSTGPISGRGNKLKLKQKEKQSQKAFTQNLQKLKQGFLKLPHMKKTKDSQEQSTEGKKQEGKIGKKN